MQRGLVVWPQPVLARRRREVGRRLSASHGRDLQPLTVGSLFASGQLVAIDVRRLSQHVITTGFEMGNLRPSVCIDAVFAGMPPRHALSRVAKPASMRLSSGGGGTRISTRSKQPATSLG